VDVIVDSSVWIAALAGETIAEIETAMAEGTLVLSPIVIAELLSGDTTPQHRVMISEWLQDYRLHETPLSHWMDVGKLRRMLRADGLNVTIPDAHVAQCALDLDATLYSRDEVFTLIAEHTPLRLVRLR
jgi:predicted nucleic acid-binding protein